MTELDVSLRDVQDEDVRAFYEQQLDPVATAMAAFPSREWSVFEAHWERIRQVESNVMKTIVVNGDVAGNAASFIQEEQRFVGYWLDRSYWGQGVATRAVSALLLEVTARPLYAHVVEHNMGSRRVLEKNGFRLIGRECTEEGVVELLFRLGSTRGEGLK
ncbi:GNAT family N-acetyltransferase [Deinococcus altitudinis]|uniref:GNAT family N-acetyltransferase n=1 Tax=Deinococcus altitudinis TaxID=468914 RepID=UPI003891366C